MSNITVLGLGAMGSRMAANYIKAGHDVTVWNRTSSTAERFAATHGCNSAESLRAAVAVADFVVSMVSDDDAAYETWLNPTNGVLGTLGSNAIAIESSTLTPDAVQRIGMTAKESGIRLIEAPVVGSRPQADAGALFYVLGGDQADIEAAQNVIDVNAGNATYAGKLGNAATMKLAINALFAVQVAAYSEIVGFIEQSDLDTGAAINTLKALPITSPGLQRILGLIDERKYTPNFPVRLVSKDLAYLNQSAENLGAPVPIANAAAAVFGEGAGAEERDLDIAGIAQRYGLRMS